MVEESVELDVRESALSATVFDAFVRLLLNEPTEHLVRETGELIRQCGEDVASGAASTWDAGKIPELQKRYCERFAIASSEGYVPLCESVVRTARRERGAWAYGPVPGMVAAHVARCYGAAGFSARSVCGSALFARGIPADHLAVELSFLSFLNVRIATAKDEHDRAGWRAYACAFADDHVSKTVDVAAAIANDKGNDAYAVLLAICAAFVSEWADATRWCLPSR